MGVFCVYGNKNISCYKKIHEDTNEKDYSKFENIVIPLKNYAYSLYSSDTDELLGTYKTDENGEFKLNAYEFFCC